MVDSAHFATDAELREKGLLGGKSGPIVGGVRDAFRRIVPLRYGGRLGISFTGPPDAGKTSSFAATNLLIPLQHENAGGWAADARRKDFFGEEPSFVVVDPKGHLARSTSAYQRDVLGKEVLVLEPLSLEEGARPITRCGRSASALRTSNMIAFGSRMTLSKLRAASSTTIGSRAAPRSAPR